MLFGPHQKKYLFIPNKKSMQSCGTMLSLITFLPYWIALTVELLVSYNLHLALGLSIEIAVCRLLMIIKVSITVRKGLI